MSDSFNRISSAEGHSYSACSIISLLLRRYLIRSFLTLCFAVVLACHQVRSASRNTPLPVPFRSVFPFMCCLTQRLNVTRISTVSSHVVKPRRTPSDDVSPPSFPYSALGEYNWACRRCWMHKAQANRTQSTSDWTPSGVMLDYNIRGAVAVLPHRRVTTAPANQGPLLVLLIRSTSTWC